MPMPGYVFKDGGPIPDDEIQGPPPSMIPLGDGLMVSRPQTTYPSTSNSSSVLDTPTSSTSPSHTSQSHTSPSHGPTESHALANADHGLKGATQIGHDEPGVKDLGWTEPPENIPKPLVGGLPNEQLWLLVRRFNKQMYHVKAINYDPPGGLDLNIADEDEFSPDKLRANIERLYMTVIIGLMGSGNHIARLRSWREPRRTAAFCATYFFAWAFNFLIPLFFTTLIALIVYPPSRHYLFPPAPLALINTKTGGIQSPKAGVLGSHDSATGAPEKHKGEAVEQEASNFVSSFTSIALSSAIGKHEQSGSGDHPIERKAPDPIKGATEALNAKDSTSTGSSPAHHDKTKQPMEEAMWTKMRPIMHVIGDIADGWERFANALSPTPPFPEDTARMRLAGVLVPAVAVALLTSSSMFMKMTTFSVGGGFFGDPILMRAYAELNRLVPDWPKYLELRRTLLKGVPTNAQLTLTLLRVGEANKAPIPPPPRGDSKEAPPDRPASLHGDHLQNLDASNAEIHDAIHADPTVETQSTHEATEAKPKHRHGSRILGFLKGTTKTSVEAKLGVDKLRANLGSKPAQEHLGVLPTPEEQKPSGPVDFKGRHHGKKGYVYITTTATTPCVSFASHSTEGTGVGGSVDPIFSVAIADIKELKKVGGLGWKAKLVVGWATDREVADGLEIVDRMGQTWRVTALPLRDELFNRLIALNGQKWESY